MPDRRNVLIGGSLAIGGLATGAMTRRPGSSLTIDPAIALPQTVGPWTGQLPEDVILPSEDVLSMNIYDKLFFRSFSRAQFNPITLVMAYGARQDYSFQVHRPEICYPASGFSIVASAKRLLPIAGAVVPANILQVRRGQREEVISYWTRIGNDFPQSTWEQRMAVLRGISNWRLDDGILVRMSIAAANLQDALVVLDAFAAELIDNAASGAKRILLGA